MRKLSGTAILAFSITWVLILLVAAGMTWLLISPLPLGKFSGVAMLGTWVVAVHALAVLTFRLFFALHPLPDGKVVPGSREYFHSEIYVLSNLLFWHPLLRNPLVPVPLMRLVLQALGARMGSNSYSAGLIQDPCLTELGENTLVGESALVIAHAIEGQALCYRRVRIGSGVTIGARSVVMPGTIIEDGAMIAAGAVVPKGTRVGSKEIWGGVPARKIKEADEQQLQHETNEGYCHTASSDARALVRAMAGGGR
jgi:acetyltransferase-like isoleucine patch superfamily enzyme